MSPSRVDLFTARLNGIKATLEKAPPKEKMQLVGRGLADDFNAILGEVAAAFPDLSGSLPNQIKALNPHRRLKADINYLDMEAMCEQVLNLLRLVR